MRRPLLSRRRNPRVRRLGQHFLSDPGILNKIVRVIDPQPEDRIIEVGAGKGAITFPLAQKAAEVIAIEKDGELVPLLRTKRQDNLTIIEKDVLRVDFRELLAAGAGVPGPVKLVGNLPYSISSPLMFKVLGDKKLFQTCVFLVQKEVAERICAQPGSKKYAPLSILVENDFSARVHFIVHPGSFSPPPRVESALISLVQRASPLFQVSDERLFLKFLQAAFRQRRKILLNNLRNSGWPAEAIQAAYSQLGLERAARPEELSLAQFVRLFEFFMKFVIGGRSS
jgi:16S rRNA (adenine1518-N6/adenine1519-N6)-dimethyltransferase